jgi:hypothetical protein
MRTVVAHGGRKVHFYETGDLVRLQRDEPHKPVTAFAGDWGRVLRVNPDGSLDIKLAGYSRANDDTITRASSIPWDRVEACDHRGKPMLETVAPVWDTRRPR